jgi:hypothetical protein
MFSALLERVARALAREGIPYMVIGGQAVLRYGEARLTQDIDLTLGVDLDRLPVVLRAVAGAGLGVLADPETFTRETMVLPCRDPETGIRVDLVFSCTKYEREAIARATPVRILETDVRFASIEDLVIHKVVAGRPRDLEDVRRLLLKNRGVSAGAVEAVLRELDLGLGESFVERFRQVRQSVEP